MDNNQFSDIQYPENLHTDEFGNSCVRFFITVARQSMMYSKGQSAAEVIDISEDDPTFGQKSIAWNARKFSDQKFNKRMLKEAISLYIPNDLQMQQSVIWQEEDMLTDIVQNIDEVFGGAAGATNAKNQILENAGSAVAGGGLAGLQLAGSVLLKQLPGAQKIAQVTPGNSKVEQLFQGVDFRTFNFNYQFNPKTAKEAQDAMRIISMFRHHMLPEFLDDSQYLYIYPQTFDIKYYTKAKNRNGQTIEVEHPYLDRHFTSVLTSCTVNYTPLGQYVAFDNGMPAHINLSLQFKELSVHTKQQTPTWGNL